MNKKITAMLLAMLTVGAMVLTACSDSDSGSTETTAQNDVQTENLEQQIHQHYHLLHIAAEGIVARLFKLGEK